MPSSLLPLILSYYSLSSQKNTFSQLIHTGHSHRSSHTEHPIDATFSFPSTQIQQDHTHHTTHSSSNEVFSVSSSSSSMRYDKTTQHKKLHDKMIDLIKERQQEYLWEWQSKNKITLFSSKILFYLTKQHQSAHCPIHVQYVSNTQKTLMFSWLPMTCLKVRGWIRSPVFLQGLEFIWHLCAQDVEDTPDMMMASSSIVQSTSPITPYLIWLITTYHSSHMTHHYSWLSQMTYHQ